MSADLKVRDNDGLTPLDMSVADGRKCKRHSMCHRESKTSGCGGNCFDVKIDPTEILVWGSNDNYSLGIETRQTRSNPELVEKFRKEKIYISQV